MLFYQSNENIYFAGLNKNYFLLFINTDTTYFSNWNRLQYTLQLLILSVTDLLLMLIIFILVIKDIMNYQYVLIKNY